MGDNDKPPQVKLIFEGILRKRFEAVKRYYGVERNADLIRMLVTLRYEEVNYPTMNGRASCECTSNFGVGRPVFRKLPTNC
jgi:hypothetical protein